MTGGEEQDKRETRNYKADEVINKIKEIVKRASKGVFHVETDGILQSGATQLRTLEIKYEQEVIRRYHVVAFSKEGERLSVEWIAGINQIPDDLEETIKNHYRMILKGPGSS